MLFPSASVRMLGESGYGNCRKLLSKEGHLRGAEVFGGGMQPTRDEPKQRELMKKSHFLFPSDLLAGVSHWSNLTRSQRAREPVNAVHTGQPTRAQSWVEKGGQNLKGKI